MHLDLKLQDLQLVSLSDELLRKPQAVLANIKKRNEARGGTGRGSEVFENRKEQLRYRLQCAISPMKELKKIQDDVIGGQRLLLSLYIESHGQDWLPPFDVNVAPLILGNDGAAWRPPRRMQAARLYFERFDELPALSFLAAQLSTAFASNNSDSGASGTWARERDVLFRTDGPERVATSAGGSESLRQLIERYAIPDKGSFSVRLRKVFLLETLKRCRFGEEAAVLQELQADREDAAVDNLPLGAAALRILVSRVAGEGRGIWPEEWPKWLFRLGCDPRLGQHTAEGNKWWRWATPSQLELARRGVTGLTLKFFIQFLEQSLRGTEKETQFALRSRFLLALFDAKKIEDTRLCLNWTHLQKMNKAMSVSEIESGSYKNYVALLSDTTDKTSVICLKCVDGIFIVEGTHTFGLRVYRGEFPIDGFWERSREMYHDRELRRGRDYIPHDQWGRWVEKFFEELRWKYHLENNWREVKL